ncbi:MAG TPA: helix-turn-helix domain-containing protein [Candidatus Eisenbacteria bacterium]|nr:helix-turn-helix domain-containing protein [Candidatus Eisenbacteria bacterium]
MATDRAELQGTAVDLAELGRRVRDERRRRGFALEALAAASGVSRSMLSAIELGQKAPTVLVLDRIATGLGTSIARLLAPQRTEAVVVLRADQQQVARDPSGWERRILSPVLPGVEFEFMRTTIGPGVSAGSFAPHAPGSREYVAIERGTLVLGIDGELITLHAGDSMYFTGDRWHSFANPAPIEPAIYYLAMDVAGHEDGMDSKATAPHVLVRP